MEIGKVHKCQSISAIYHISYISAPAPYKCIHSDPNCRLEEKPHNRLHSDSRRLSKSIRATPVETRPSLSYVQPVVIVPKKLTFLDSLAEWFEIITAIRVPSMKSPDTFLQSRFLKIIQASEKRTHVMPVLFGNQPVFPSLRQNVKIHQIDCKTSSYSDLAFASLLVCVLVSHHIFVLASIPKASHAFTYICMDALFSLENLPKYSCVCARDIFWGITSRMTNPRWPQQ